MITSVSSSSIPDPGSVAIRPSPDELSKKRDASPVVGVAAPVPNPSEADSAVVQLSSEAVRLSSQSNAKAAAGPVPVAPNISAAPAAVSAAAASAASPATVNSVKKYADADANQDGRVSVLEARAYDFAHPAIPKPERDGDQPPARHAIADVKAYEAVARSG